MKKVTSKFPGKRVLIVEDNILNQEVISDILESAECTIDIASNGVEAVQKAEIANYDLILMDLQLPHMDGFQATQFIRKQEKKTDTHAVIIALTATFTEKIKEKCFEFNMDGFLLKPLDVAKLENLLNQYLNIKVDGTDTL